MSPVGISLLMLLAFAGFAWLAWRKLQIVLALQPEVRWDQPGSALRSVLVNGLLQQRMMQREWRAGPDARGDLPRLHVAAAAQAAADRHRLRRAASSSRRPSAGRSRRSRTASNWPSSLAVLYAFWRRFVLRPPRLEPQPRGGAGAVADPGDHGHRLRLRRLSLRAAVRPGAGDRARARLRLRRRRGGQCCSRACRRRRCRRATCCRTGRRWWWCSASWCCCRRASTSTSSPRCRRCSSAAAGPANRVPGVDIDKLMEATDEADMKAGVRTARDLTWKDGLDAFTCTECGRCKDACPTHLTGKPLSLKAVNDSLKHHLLEQREAIVAGDPKNELPRAGGPGDQRGHAVGLHHLRLLRGGLPDRARAPGQVLPHAPAPGDDRRRVPARAEEGVRGLRVAGQPLGPAGRPARRLGARAWTCRSSRTRGRCGRPGLPVLRRLGDVLRPARAEDRARLRRHPAARRRALRHPRARARAPPASACAASATRCCSSNWPPRWSARWANWA